jgi:sugar/nucleoside kinase (ribokinase family)
MAEVLVFGTVAADVVLRVPTLPAAGDHVTAEPLGWRLGGSSANFACGLAGAGHRVELIGPVAADAMADALTAQLAERGVRTPHVVRVDGVSPRALILLDSAGERTILVLSGAVGPVPQLSLPPSRDVACVYVESYGRFPMRIADAYADALLVTTVPAPGHTSWPADVIVGSQSDFPPDALADPYAWARPAGTARLQWVVVTRGAAGADAYGATETHHEPPRQARQIDSTGAGDAFAAALVASLLAGQPIDEAMAHGAIQGAAAVEVLQSLPPDWVESIDAT